MSLPSSMPPCPIDHDALVCALVLAPATFSRNRFFGLFTDPVARKARARAAQLRAIVRHLATETAGGGPRARIIDEQPRPGGGAVLRYAIDDLGFVRTAYLDAIELSALRFALHRATSGRAVLPLPDRALVERALSRLARELVPVDTEPPPL